MRDRRTASKQNKTREREGDDKSEKERERERERQREREREGGREGGREGEGWRGAGKETDRDKAGESAFLPLHLKAEHRAVEAAFRPVVGLSCKCCLSPLQKHP